LAKGDASPTENYGHPIGPELAQGFAVDAFRILKSPATLPVVRNECGMKYVADSYFQNES
jgi:hypothetical protein